MNVAKPMLFLQQPFGGDFLLQHQVRWRPSPQVPRRSCQVALNKTGASDVITWIQWQWWDVQQVAVRLLVSGETLIKPPCKSCHCNRQTILKSVGIDALGVPIRTQQTIDQQEWLWGVSPGNCTPRLYEVGMSQEQVIHSIVVSWATKWVSTETPVPSERPGWLMGVPKGFGSNIGLVHSPHWTGACSRKNHWPMVVLSTAQKS